jgi:TusA-related sulfurtransferase
MKIKVDACGLSCPEPVLKLKQVIDKADEIDILVDSQVCVDNCSRFAQSKGFDVAVNGGSGQYTVSIRKDSNFV